MSLRAPAKQSSLGAVLDCFVAYAARSDGAQTLQCPCIYTLSLEQRALLQSMHGSAATWAAIRAGSSRGTLDADAYEALRADYDAVMAEIVKQDQTAAKKRDEQKSNEPAPAQ